MLIKTAYQNQLREDEDQGLSLGFKAAEEPSWNPGWALVRALQFKNNV
jgi:hypothetical protein